MRTGVSRASESPSDNLKPMTKQTISIREDNNNNNPRTILIVLSSWPLKVIARVHSVHLMNAAQRTSSCQPSDQATWLGLWVRPPVGSYRLQPPSPFINITQPESWYSFTIPCRVEGWVDLGIAGRVHTARAQGCKSQWLCDKHNCPQRDSIPGPRALQSDMLPLDHCDLRYRNPAYFGGRCSWLSATLTAYYCAKFYTRLEHTYDSTIKSTGNHNHWVRMVKVQSTYPCHIRYQFM